MKRFRDRAPMCLILAVLFTFSAFSTTSCADEWSWSNPLPTGYDLQDVYAASPTDIFAVGLFGTIIHYDGTDWSIMDIGTYAHFQGVWGSSGSDVYAVASGGVAYHYDGSSWSAMTTGTTTNLYDIWGIGSDVFVVGYGTAIFHYNGSTWTQMGTPIAYMSYTGIWGTSATDVYAVGTSGTILHYDGSSWSAMTSGTSNMLYGIWGTSSSDIFAVGQSGTILHYDGSSWSAMTSGTTSSLQGVWGSSGSDVHAVGPSGFSAHYDGSNWSETTSGASKSFYGCSGTGTDFYGVGSSGIIYHHDGSDWSAMSSGSLIEQKDVWVNSGTDVFSVGYSGSILHYDGSVWSAMSSGTTNHLMGVWGSSGTDVFAVGSDGTILHYDGISWSTMTSNTTEILLGIWGLSSTNVYAVGGNGTILHYDGISWSSMTSGNSNHLNNIWGNNQSDIYAVGYNGTILHYNGSTWSAMTSGTTTTLFGIWGQGADIFASGYSGTILHYDGSSWSTMSSGTAQNIMSLWGKTSSHVFAVGWNYTILLYDGASWSQMDTGGIIRAEGIAGVDNDVFLSGSTGLIRTYNDTYIPPSRSCYQDLDQDGYGTSATVTAADGLCDTLESESYFDTDCNDSDADSYPGATEVVAEGGDQDCNGEEICYTDNDDDGYRPDASSTVTSADGDCADSGEALGSDPTGDCDDTAGSVHPTATEVAADGVDQDCDGSELCYKDSDDDGYRPDGSSTVSSVDLDCTDSGEADGTAPTGDCNDAVGTINPGAIEVAADGVDQDCNGTELCYKDSDDDGYRPDGSSTVSSVDLDCTDSGEADGAAPTGDCDDTTGSVNPGATEVVADGVDQNCDGDELCFQDNDGDSYGSSATMNDDGNLVCTDAGEAANSNDCNDNDGAINPGAVEICDGIDNNCNNALDENGVCTSDSFWLLFLPEILNNAQKQQ